MLSWSFDNSWSEKQDHIYYEFEIGLSFSNGSNSSLIYFNQVSLNVIHQLWMAEPSKEMVKESGWLWVVFHFELFRLFYSVLKLFTGFS